MITSKRPTGYWLTGIVTLLVLSGCILIAVLVANAIQQVSGFRGDNEPKVRHDTSFWHKCIVLPGSSRMEGIAGLLATCVA